MAQTIKLTPITNGLRGPLEPFDLADILKYDTAPIQVYDVEPGVNPRELPSSIVEMRDGRSLEVLEPVNAIAAKMDRRYPVPATCPHCGGGGMLQPPAGDWDRYVCPTCGEFCVSGTAQKLIELGTLDPRKARLVPDAEGCVRLVV